MCICYQYMYSLTLDTIMESQTTVLWLCTVVPGAVISKEDIQPRLLSLRRFIVPLLLAMIIIGFQIPFRSKVRYCVLPAETTRAEYENIILLN